MFLQVIRLYKFIPQIIKIKIQDTHKEKVWRDENLIWYVVFLPAAKAAYALLCFDIQNKWLDYCHST